MRTEMDQYLASIYDTEDTIEKMAQYESLYKQAEQEGIVDQLDGLSQEQLDELAAVQLSAINGQEEQVPQDTTIKQAEANLELADYMGRIMAHAFYQESGLIEKAAGLRDTARDVGTIGWAGGQLAKHHAGRAASAVAGGARRAAGAVGGAASRAGGAVSGAARSAGSAVAGGARRAGSAVSGAASRAGSAISGAAGRAKEHVKDHGAPYAMGAGLAGGAAGGYVAGKLTGHKKLANENAGAFEEAARMRAAQILQEQGFDTGLLGQFIEEQDILAQQEAEQQALMEQAQQQQQLEAQQNAQQQYQQQQQLRAQQQQQHVQQMQQPRTQNVAPQAMQQTGQQQQQGAQYGVNPMAQRAQAGRPGQVAPQQGQQFQQGVADPQAQQVEAIKMANDMMQQQFNQALDEAAWNILAQAGYPIEEGQEAQQAQMGQPQTQLPGQVVQ